MANLVELRSEAGQVLLEDVYREKKFNQPLLQGIFSKQIGSKNCGVQTCALLMGAAKLGTTPTNTEQLSQPGVSLTPPISESQMFEFEETLKVTNQAVVERGGLSLKSVADILTSHGFVVKTYFASESSVDEFRREATAGLGSGASTSGVVVNYLMSTLGQGEHLGGHHSPLGAYNESSDRFLILDTWPDTRECWATAEDIFQAMDTQDTSTAKSRGFCVVYF